MHRFEHHGAYTGDSIVPENYFWRWKITSNSLKHSISCWAGTNAWWWWSLVSDLIGSDLNTHTDIETKSKKRWKYGVAGSQPIKIQLLREAALQSDERIRETDDVSRCGHETVLWSHCGVPIRLRINKLASSSWHLLLLETLLTLTVILISTNGECSVRSALCR